MNPATGRRVVVSGMGIVSPFGVGVPTFKDNIFRGNTGAGLITHFDTTALSTRFAAQAPVGERDFEALVDNQKSLKTLSRSGRFAVMAAAEAMADAALDRSKLDPYRFGTSVGAGGFGLEDVEHFHQRLEITSAAVNAADGRIDPARFLQQLSQKVNPLTPLKGLSNIPTAHIAIQHNARGHCQTISTACTSSAQAVGDAYRQIKFGVADVMLAGGADSMINPNGLLLFGMVGVMSKNNGAYRTASRPFDRERDGFMVGEGGAMLVLEELEHCRRRGATPYGEVAGYAATCDAYRLTDEPAEAWGAIAAMKLALADAQMNPADIDYINAHGTGTRMNDRTETYAIKEVFGGRAYAPAVSSTKSMIGHLVAAAGAAEFITCVLALQQSLLPPTINYENADPECDLDCVPNQAREHKLNAILSNSFGFGGQNACLLLRRFQA